MNEYVYQKPQNDNVNLEVIFDQGTLNHQALTEPHKAHNWLKHTTTHPTKAKQDFDLAMAMAKTVLKDELCRRVILSVDFRREWEFYRQNVHGIRARCKADGDSKILKTVFEYKGLAVTTEKAFDEAIDNFDYDQGVAWYLDTTHYDRVLIAAVSKKKPDMLFKRIVDRNHQIYLRGEQKVLKAVKYWNLYFN